MGDSSTYLQALTLDQKKEVCLRRIITAATYSSLSEWIEEQYGLAVSSSTISRFMASDEGVSLLKSVHQEVRETFKDQPLVEKASRILAFQAKMQQLDREMSRIDPGNADMVDHWKTLSQEYRQYAKLIQDEMVGIKISVNDNASPAEIVARKILEQAKGIDAAAESE